LTDIVIGIEGRASGRDHLPYLNCWERRKEGKRGGCTREALKRARFLRGDSIKRNCVVGYASLKITLFGGKGLNYRWTTTTCLIKACG